MRFRAIHLAAWALAAALLAPSAAQAIEFLSENFEGLTLGPNQDEALVGEAVWTNVPPTGWTWDNTGVPGFGNDATDGVTEWAGWGFADKDWWVETAGDQGRVDFELGQGIVAIADPDEWDDQTHDPGLYDVYMKTPVFSVAGFVRGQVSFQMDSSFRPEGPDDDPALYNDQSPVVRVSYNGGAFQEILRWSSDKASPNYKAAAENEHITIPLNVPKGTTTMQVEFGLERAENDWWWAIDNIIVSDNNVEEFKIVVDDLDGDVAIVNDSNAAVNLKGYTIASASGSMVVNQWTSLSDSGDAGAGWLESGNASANNITETNFNGSFVVAPGESLYLGKLYEVGGDRDIAFTYVTAGGAFASGFVGYYDFEGAAPTLLGDTNDDGVVDIVDLNNVRNNFGATGLGDTDGNGSVDITDLNNVRNNFGATAGANAVPEPSGLALLGLGAVVAGWFGRRRR